MPLPEPKPLRLVDSAKDGRITILHLTDKTCKWPIGDPQHDDFCFCGHGPRDGSPYCEYHARIAYQPAQERRLRREESGKPATSRDTPREVLIRKLREVEARPLADLAGDGDEFALVIVRRTGNGEVMLVGEIADDHSLFVKARKRLIS